MGLGRYIMVGGFLGAGKTTSLVRMADTLSKKGLKVGLITNDQGLGLVDTAIAKAHDHPVREIGGGCFCCRFNSLMDAARSLQENEKPDVFLAEPVGSCTDLVATVCLPMARMYGDEFVVAPLSIVIDPVRALSILGLEERKKFSENVVYIYRKQLEEAQLLIVNKCDAVAPERLEILRKKLEEEYPRKQILLCSAKEGTNTQKWFDLLMHDGLRLTELMEIDYERYGEGEALLGWLNATLMLEWQNEVDGNAFLKKIGKTLQESLQEVGSEIAHLKMTLGPVGDPFDIAAGNIVRGDGELELSHQLIDDVEEAELILNLRAESEPELLVKVLHGVIKDLKNEEIGVKVEHLEHFKPGKPVPVHREQNLVELES